MNHHDIELKRTCSVYPEQYDAFLGESQVGYLRLRHGEFTVDVPDADGEPVFTAHPRGSGRFEYDEGDHFLEAAKCAIATHFKPTDVR